MLVFYQQFETENGVLPLAPNYDARRQVAINGLQKMYAPNILVAILTLLVLITFYFFYRMNNRE